MFDYSNLLSMSYFRGMDDLPPVVKNLLIINVLVWLAQIVFASNGLELENFGALWSLESGNFKIWQLVTHMFMHAARDEFGSIEFMHIFFNMFTLFIFGRILESFWGSKRFLEFYIFSGLVAGGVQLLMGGFTLAVGASGAIMGLMAGFAYLFPNTELYMMFVPVPIKAKIAIPLLMAIDLFGGISNTAGDNVAHWAHLGGAVAGLGLVFFWNRKNRRDFY